MRPICGQCAKVDVAADCEYSDAGLTTSQILERNIANLEARINEILKGPSVDSVSLQRPYAGPDTPKASRPKLPALVPTPPSVSPSPVPPMSIVDQHSQTPIKPLECIQFPDSPGLSVFSCSSFFQSLIVNCRLQTFFAVAPHLGFFFYIPRFLDKVKLSMPPTNLSPIPPALVFSVLLLDCVFSNSPDRQFLEPQLLALALQSLSNDLHPSKILYTLQAEVLIALYLLHQNRRLAASYHVSAAVSITVACNLHKIRSARGFGETQATITLMPPLDDIEEGERIRAFWTVYILDRGWTVWTHSSSALLDESSPLTQIDTPWPMESHEYETVS